MRNKNWSIFLLDTSAPSWWWEIWLHIFLLSLTHSYTRSLLKRERKKWKCSSPKSIIIKKIDCQEKERECELAMGWNWKLPLNINDKYIFSMSHRMPDLISLARCKYFLHQSNKFMRVVVMSTLRYAYKLVILSAYHYQARWWSLLIKF